MNLVKTHDFLLGKKIFYFTIEMLARYRGTIQSDTSDAVVF